MPSGSSKEIVELKKQINHLREYNTELKEMNQEYSDQIGKLQDQLLQLKNQRMFFEQSRANQNKEVIRRGVEDIFLEEKKTIEKLQKENDELKSRIKLQDKMIKDRDNQIQRLQRENNDVKKQLIEFGDKHEAKDFIDKLNERKDIIEAKEDEYRKLLNRFNELVNKTEKVIYENRVLRQIADVPENFGIDIEKIEMGDKVKIEDYKAKIRILKQEVDELETERAQLKHRIMFIASTMQATDQPFASLTPEQRVEVARYAQDLADGKVDIPDTTTDLKNKIRELQAQLDLLTRGGGSTGLLTGLGRGGNNTYYGGDNQMGTLSTLGGKTIVSHNGEILIGAKVIQAPIVDKNNNIIPGAKKNQDGTIVDQNGNVVKGAKEMAGEVVVDKNGKIVPGAKTVNKNQGLGGTGLTKFRQTGGNFAGYEGELEGLKQGQEEIKRLIQQGGFNSAGFNNTGMYGGTMPVGYGTQQQFSDPQGQQMVPYINLGVMQLPSIPLRNFIGEVQAGTYRFNSFIKVEPDKLHTLFGLCTDETDPEKLKVESAALQSQILELLEIEARRNKNDETLNDDLKNLFGKYEKLCQIQNEVFYRYMETKKGMNEAAKKNAALIDNLNAEAEILRRDNNRFKEDLFILGQKNYNEIETKYVEKVKEISILEAKLIKLQRKFDCLFEEEGKLREFLEDKENSELEKDKMFKDTVTKLKAWKSMLIFYLKLIMKKLRNSVDKKNFEKIATENKFLREKNNELVYQDLSLTKIKCLYKNLRTEYKRLENDFYECEELKLDAQTDLNFLRKRISDIDPSYKVEQLSFRKVSRRINELHLSYGELKRVLCRSANQNVPSQSRVETSSRENEDEIKRTQKLLDGLNTDNSLITKVDFERGLEELRVIGGYISKNDIKLCYKYLNCEETNDIDIRTFLKKIEQCSVNELELMIHNKEILLKFITCVRNSGQNLQTTFEFFDTNNNGYITRDEFKFALNQMKFPIDDDTINKLVLLVSEESIEKFTLNQTDTFNYREFCSLFEQKAQNLLLKKKKVESAKKNFNIDWRTNILIEIISAINNIGKTPEAALLGWDRRDKGFIYKQDFFHFIDDINAAVSLPDREKIFYDFDSSQQDVIPMQVLVNALNKAKKDAETYQAIMEENSLGGNMNDKIDTRKRLMLVTEEKEFLAYKVNQLQKKIIVLEESNSDIEKEMESFRNKNGQIIKRYYDTVNKLQEYKEKYVDTGITRKDLDIIEEQNDQLMREVTILRVGLNTFKDLYNSANHQNKYIHINNCINSDELTTYKRAVKELQSENNQNALIGKLYYTILISRWREANVSRNFDEFSLNFTAMKEDNMQMQIQNQTLTKDLSDLSINYQDNVIESMMIQNELDNYRNGFATSDSSEYFKPFDDMKRLIKNLTEEKITLNERILTLKKDNIKLENQKDELNAQVAYAQELENNIKFNNTDEYSKKLIAYCDEISKLRVSDNKNRREKDFHKDNEEHLDKIKNELQEEIRKLEEENAVNESKLRKIEDVFKAKDDERTRKLIAAIEKMKLYNKDEIMQTLFDNTLPNKNNMNNNNNKGNAQTMPRLRKGNQGGYDNDNNNQTFPAPNNDPNNNMGGGRGYQTFQGRRNENNNNNLSQSQMQNNSLRRSRTSNMNGNSQEDFNNYPKDELVKKINDYNKILNLKDKEIEKLNKNIMECKALIEQNAKFYEDNSVPNLVGETGYKKIRDDDTQMIAETAQKTIKTLQDMLNQKNNLILLKDNQIEKLNNENQKMKVDYLKQIASLQDHIKNDHDSTMKKLGNIIDNSNPNLVVKMSRSDLSILTLNDLEKLINEKDNAIKALATELKLNQEEKDTIYFELGEKNKKIFQLEDELKLRKIKAASATGGSTKTFADENLRKDYEDKLKELEKEKENLERMKIEYRSKIEQASSMKEATLDNTSYVPEKLIVNKEKSDLYVKIEQLRKRNTKLTEEKKKMLKEKEEFETEKQKLIDRISRVQSDSKVFQECQLRDMKKLTKLTKENDKLKKDKEDLKKENDYLRGQLEDNRRKQNLTMANQNTIQNLQSSSQIPSQIPNQSIQKSNAFQPSQSGTRQKRPSTSIQRSPPKKDFSSPSSTSYKAEGAEQSSQNWNVSSSKAKPKVSSPAEGKEKLERLVYRCLEKRINLCEQLKRYDLGGSGKITTEQFRKSIDELKLGFIDRDFELLEKASKATEGYIIIDDFVELAKSVDPNYRDFIDTSLANKNFDSKVTKKYNPFENKNYNINY